MFVDTRFQNNQRDLGQLNQLFGGSCKHQNDRCGYFDEGVGTWVYCDADPTGQCDNWALTSYYFPTGADPQGNRYLNWWPQDPPANVVCGGQDYQNYVGTSTRAGRRQETFYHLGRLQSYWQDWLGVSLPRTRAYIVWDPNARQPLNYCGGGITWGQNTMSITCPLCAFVQRDLDYENEALTRSTIAHEFGHVADASLHNNMFSSASEADLPWNNVDWYQENGQWKSRSASALTEAIAMFSANSSGKYEYSHDAYLGKVHGSPRNPGYRYPTGYYCGHGQGGPTDLVGVYDRARIWMNVWTDCHLSSGPPGLRAWRNHIASAQFTGGQLRLLDPSCINTFDYDACPVGRYESTFYRKHWYAATSWGMGYEAVRAWQRRMADWDVGPVTSSQCHGPSPNPPMTNLDPDSDYAPWFDDVPDRWWQAPILPVEAPVRIQYPDAIDGPFPYGYCVGAGGGQPCDPLTMDFSSDRDYFIFYARAGETYRIYTMPGDGASPSTDTILELRGPSDALIISNDDCGIAGLPAYGTWFSCIRYTFSETQPYRIVVKPKIAQGRALGSKARYVLHVEMQGDDYADAMEEASPMLQSATGAIQSSDDLDWLYLTVWDDADVFLNVERSAGSVSGVLMNQEGEWIALFGLDASHPTYSNTFSLPKGTYYLAMAGTQGARYLVSDFEATYSVWPGTTRDAAINLFDPEVPTLLPNRAITYRFQSPQKHYYRFYADRNEIFIFDVFGTARVSVVPDRTNNPIYQRLAVNTEDPDPSKNETEVDVEWGTLLEDAFGGIRAQGSGRRSSYLSFVAPWEGWYFAVVEKEGDMSQYVLWAANGLVWLDEPEDP